MAFSLIFLGASNADAETRSLKLFFIHTNEKAEIVFKRNGVYDQAGLKKINMFLRDWRRNEPTKMNPRLMDLIWETYRAVGARDYIHVVCGYRSPATNSMLRSRSSGVAKKSQHMLGNAMDFYIPGVSLKKLRETGMKMQTGGVGYYPRSGSPFVHMDVGNVRHWPKMSRRELVALFPNGKTLHVPSDGKPLPGFDEAMASYQARKKSGMTALALASTGSSKPSKSLWASLFGGGGGADDEEDSAPDEAAPVATRKAAPQPQVAEQPAPKAKAPLPGIQIISPEDADRADVPMMADAAPVEDTPETIVAALPARSVPLPIFAPRPKADVGPAEETVAAPAEISTASVAPQEQVPFAMAQEAPAELASQAEAATIEPPAVSLHIPLPTARPDSAASKMAAADASEESQEQLLMALASDDNDPLAMTDAVPAPAERVAAVGEDTSADETDDGEVAALPSARPEMTAAPATAADQAAVAAAIKANDARVAALASVADSSNTSAVATGSDLQPAAGMTVKTTRKSARAARTDGKPDRKSLVVAAEPKAARWVLDNAQVAKVTTDTKAPSFAYNAVVTAPREVYTAGFQKADQSSNPNRFTGKAVTFLSVARFE